MRICACISREEDLSSAELEKADLLELRLDLMGALPRRKPSLPFIATFHPDSAADADIEAVDAQRWASEMGASCLDLDVNEALLIDDSRIRIIRSWHDWEGTPDEQEILEILETARGDVAKAAFQVHGVRDLLSLLRASRSFQKPRVLLGMGIMGQVTRLRPQALGSEFSYASVGLATAPGQIALGELREFGADGIITGLIGHPIAHSLSPALHREAFRSTGLQGRYLLLDIPEGEDLQLLPEIMEGYSITGLNVTMPHKVAIMDILDSIDPLAEEAGAVNSIHWDGSALHGHNSDLAGLEGSLLAAGVDLQGVSALLIGNGGAARAAATLLRRNDCELHVSARSPDRGREFASEQGAEFIPVRSLAGRHFDLIINATPAGMRGEMPIPREALSPGQAVMDMIYRPRITPLLQAARDMGSTVISGEEMLLRQAWEAFRIWTGREPDMAAMREAMR